MRPRRFFLEADTCSAKSGEIMNRVTDALRTSLPIGWHAPENRIRHGIALPDQLSAMRELIDGP